MQFSIIHPSWGRPGQAFDSLRHVFNSSAQPELVEYLLLVNFDDPKLPDYKNRMDLMLASFKPQVRLIISNERDERGASLVGAVAPINLGAKLSNGEALWFASDDFYYPAYWDKLIREKVVEEAGGNNEWIVRVNEGDLSRMWNKKRYLEGYISNPVISRGYYLKKGYVVFPEYNHLYGDVDLYEEIMRDRVQVINLGELKCDHRHYQSSKTAYDDAYKRTENLAVKGRELFKKRWGF